MATSADSSFAASAPEQGSGRKRSFEEARGDTDDAIENGDGPRKRSRESTPEDAKKDSAAVPGSDNVSEPDPKDPVPATPKDLATDESSPGTFDSPDVEVIVISDSEPEDFNAPHGIIEIIEISSDSESESESESELEVAKVPVSVDVIPISDSESESEEEAQTPALSHAHEGGLDSSELKSPGLSVSRENTPESEILGAQVEHPARNLSEASSSDWSSDQETWCFVEREDTPESKIPGAQTEKPARSPSEASSSGWSSGQETWFFVESDNTNTYSQDPKKLDTADAMNDDDAKALPKKRSLEQLQEEGAKEAEKTENKRHRDNSQERETQTANAFAKSAFANAAASSPFASLGGSTSTSTAEKPASTSAFASSALSSFAGSDNSPFGSLGSSKSSVFKSGSGMSGFGSSSTSGFGSLKSGFAGVSGGFAAAAKSGGLTNFASPNAPVTLGGESKPSKPIGADESGDEGSDSESGEETTAFEADKTDERFYEQTIETGEEEEENLFTCKGKLFHFSSGEWKERGVGTFKVNSRTSETGKQHGRMIMRADGALRVMLNSPVFKGMTFGDAKNQEPTSKQILLASNEEGRTVPLLLRVGNEALAKDLYVIIKDLLDGE
ncbi:hypothetical protein PMG11_07815 [Penicillium brasilianum]|nr:hypothetical protein PMG11_07815 [Penicillium brasilianum]